MDEVAAASKDGSLTDGGMSESDSTKPEIDVVEERMWTSKDLVSSVSALNSASDNKEQSNPSQGIQDDHQHHDQPVSEEDKKIADDMKERIKQRDDESYEQPELLSQILANIARYKPQRLGFIDPRIHSIPELSPGRKQIAITSAATIDGIELKQKKDEHSEPKVYESLTDEASEHLEVESPKEDDVKPDESIETSDDKTEVNIDEPETKPKHIVIVLDETGLKEEKEKGDTSEQCELILAVDSMENALNSQEQTDDATDSQLKKLDCQPAFTEGYFNQNKKKIDSCILCDAERNVIVYPLVRYDDSEPKAHKSDESGKHHPPEVTVKDRIEMKEEKDDDSDSDGYEYIGDESYESSEPPKLESPKQADVITDSRMTGPNWPWSKMKIPPLSKENGMESKVEKDEGCDSDGYESKGDESSEPPKLESMKQDDVARSKSQCLAFIKPGIHFIPEVFEPGTVGDSPGQKKISRISAAAIAKIKIKRYCVETERILGEIDLRTSYDRDYDCGSCPGGLYRGKTCGLHLKTAHGYPFRLSVHGGSSQLSILDSSKVKASTPDKYGFYLAATLFDCIRGRDNLNSQQVIQCIRKHPDIRGRCLENCSKTLKLYFQHERWYMECTWCGRKRLCPCALTFRCHIPCIFRKLKLFE